MVWAFAMAVGLIRRLRRLSVVWNFQTSALKVAFSFGARLFETLKSGAHLLSTKHH